MFSLKGKSAVITGGGSGIGKEISLLFAKQGAKVYILELNEQSAKQVVDEIQAFGEAHSFLCDVSNQEQVLATFSRMDKVDILVNNAGIAHIGNLEKTAETDFERVYQVNVKGAYNCLYAAIPLMKKAGGGAVLNMASIASVVGIADRFAYSMSKGAIYAMSMSVARDFIADGIRSNSISPARVHTP
ncbi:MAG: SDR family oxidoreductase, partial [Flavobacterium sp.]|nr:SDR family oxidoreductase [Pedobacter sp.]